MKRVVGVCAALLATVSAASLEAQTIRGSVTDEEQSRPVAGADVRLLDEQRNLVARAASGPEGHFALPADPGNYYLIVDFLGLRRLESPLFSLGEDRDVTIDFELPTDPIELEGLRVAADRLEEIKAEVARFGVRADNIGERFVDAETIARRATARNFGHVLQWQSIPQMRVYNSTDYGLSEEPYVCVKLRMNSERCAVTVLNGGLITLETAAAIPPEAIEAMVVLDPYEATTLYGTEGGGGAVLLFTRVGR